MVNPRLLSSAPTSRGLAFDLIRSQASGIVPAVVTEGGSGAQR